MTKYGRPASVVPASRTLAMLGWSIRASACRSASNRAITCRRVHARLDELQGHLAADRLRLLGHADGAHAALADLLQQLVRADRPRRARSAGGRGRRRSTARRGAAAARGSCPACAWACSRRLDPRAQRRRRRRRPRPGRRPAPAGVARSSGVRKIDRSARRRSRPWRPRAMTALIEPVRRSGPRVSPAARNYSRGVGRGSSSAGRA